ncbi:DUF5681 domain-containing protein [Bradyrhizobium genosp. L]|uniref:DUF5681 domain-containing protein n=1 Tax=Bradyrhizobium genosp. L TaxID=83637 RepID=UPI001FEEA579|nr:DUF5681 domain-containing protein [Bradyrhizobium genosp. L]
MAMPVKRKPQSDPPEATGSKQGNTQFKPGQSGNPLGRPKGSRNKLGEAFIEAMHEDFQTHGKTVIETVRSEKPDQYLKVIASILPKELHVKDATLDDMSDNELVELLAAVRSLTASNGGKAAGRRGRKEEGEEGAGTARRTH